jgi:type II secretory pathway pseudopilin PulG
MKFNLLKKNKGFTLVETLVAISIFTVSILGLISILASGVSDISYAKQKIVASYLAQEGIEYVRNMRDTAVLYPSVGQTAQDMWNTFTSGLPKTIPCSDSSCPVFSSDFPSFIREIKMSSVSGTLDEVKITSTVTWTQGSGNYNITFSEDLFNWVE